jgi:hypothetical protein
MKLTRTAGISAVVAVLAAGGITAAVINSHAAADPAAVAGTKSADASNAKDLGAIAKENQPGATKPGPTGKAKQPVVAALTPAQVRYQHQSWGDPKNEVGIVILAPKGWKMVKLSTLEVKFTSPNQLWNLRVNGSPADKPLKTLADGKYKTTAASTAGFKLVSRVDGTTKATNPNFAGMVFHHTTLTYSYTQPARGRRLVVDRYVGLDDSAHTFFEISAGGRPEDAAALAAITAKATADYIRLP